MAGNSLPPKIPSPVAAPVPAPSAGTMSASGPVWKCELQGLDSAGKPAPLEGDITVGQHLSLKCLGEPVDFKDGALKIENPKELPFALHIIEVQRLLGTEADLVVVPWAAGKLEIKGAKLTDGTHRAVISDLSINVASVVDQQKNPEGKPFPPLGAMRIMWPLYVWIVLAAVVIAIGSLVTFVVLRRLRRRRFLAELAKHEAALTPYDQFNKELRKLTRELPVGDKEWTPENARLFFGDLGRSLRWFIARELKADVLEAKASRLVSEVKKARPELFKSGFRDLAVLFAELVKAAASPKPNVQDAHQLVELSRQVADRVHSAREGRN